ncbi:hypothetical protein [Sphingomonas sp. Root241]|uniref:hypothetical protein n=1 Tax=Sphingomonas sp. Root241 TaxID=1736501 RepID=UPI0006F33EE8|nr:hypothetical protein [Sphingomonas sp. Root241]KRC80133.1 hypothetical protein ASE13_14040 [Sphingomonas sp. Root241]
MRKFTNGGRMVCGLAILLATATIPTQALPAGQRAGAPVALALDRLEVVNRTATAARGEIRLNAAPDTGLAWIAGIARTEGCLSLEVRGSNEFGRSFVGIAFRGTDKDTYDVVYVRPFRFRSEDPALAAHGLQYMSMPDHPWPVLRERSPGVYESAIGSAPDPNDWVHLMVRFRGGRMQAFVNGAAAPQLDLPLLTQGTGGRAALWVGNNSSGAFRNLRDCS